MFSKELQSLRQECLATIFNVASIKKCAKRYFRNQKILVIGPVTRRAILILTEGNRGFLVGLNVTIKELIETLKIETIISTYDDYTCFTELEEHVIYKLESPKIKLIGLYHPENFPLPRFHLGLSDIAGAIRKNYNGQVDISDLQLGEDISTLISNIKEERYDIIGISATFGQQDLLNEIWQQIKLINSYTPLIVAGGSLCALNAEYLVKEFPNIIVANGYGETTMQDLIEYWHGERTLEQVNHITYRKDGQITTSSKRIDDKEIFSTPELDLLEDTLRLGGVMQLESSRGCTYNCSFCPRTHKGVWSGNLGGQFDMILPYVKAIFDLQPKKNKKIFLVDEEYIGYSNSDDVVRNRALNVGKELNQFGFTFETSTRVDQVYRPNKNKDWHLERINFWHSLKDIGLDKILMGVESGVDSILSRFNKKTSAQQNIYAVRLLSLIGVPMRLTYITFDQLMTMGELIRSYNFQGRKDILLNPVSNLPPERLFELIHDEEFCRENSNGNALYSEISYMMVSMEPLLGSKYLALVEKEGLAEDISLSMGRRNARYRDYRIGIMSEFSQKWIDRNFALDYTLKSIYKISNFEERTVIADLRKVLKDSAYMILGEMLAIVNNSERFLSDSLSPLEHSQVVDFSKKWDHQQEPKLLRKMFQIAIDNRINQIIHLLQVRYNELNHLIPIEHTDFINKELIKWKNKEDWSLINA